MDGDALCLASLLLVEYQLSWKGDYEKNDINYSAQLIIITLRENVSDHDCFDFFIQRQSNTINQSLGIGREYVCYWKIRFVSLLNIPYSIARERTSLA